MTTINLVDLDGVSGFRLEGVDPGDHAGFSIGRAGDINGDGFEDVIVGAYGGDGAANSEAGEAYVVFGRSIGLPAVFNLSALNGSNGFRLDGFRSGDNVGASVAGAGDFNGDGLDDLIVGAPDRVPDGFSDSGDSFIVYGRLGGFAPSLDLSTLTAAQGVVIRGGAVVSDYSGASVRGLGDINGDGVDDVLIGAYGADPGGRSQAGVSYVVFGVQGDPGAVIDQAALNGADGFRIEGVDAGDRSGRAVANAGDIDGDGVNDLIIGAYYGDAAGLRSGEAYVVFGQTGPSPAAVQLAGLNGADGFRIDGYFDPGFGGGQAGVTVAAAGDVNGDGFHDLIVGAHLANVGAQGGAEAGRAFVLFGQNGGFGSSFALADIDGVNGFEIHGAAAYDRLGSAVAGAGDVNGDGFDDVLVGAIQANGGTGAGYVVFGRATPAGAIFNVGTIDASSGIVLNGVNSFDLAGAAVDGAGDFDGDSFDDILIGAADAESDTGEGYLVRGFDSGVVTHQGTDLNDDLVGDPAANVMVGGRGIDNLVGGGGADALNGGFGEDVISVADLGFRRVDGGAGRDTLVLDGSALTLDFTAPGDQNVRDIEVIDLAGPGGAVVFDALSVLSLSSTTNSIGVVGAPGSTLSLPDAPDWTAVRASNVMVTLQNGLAELNVAADVALPAEIVIPPPAQIFLGGLNGGDGFQIVGERAFSYFGASVSGAGDIDGDGFADVIGGAPRSTDQLSYQGESFVVFGDGAAFPATRKVADLNGADGFRLVGADAFDYAGIAVGGAGDIDGDGLGDLIVGGYGGSNRAGESYVVFGATGGFPADIMLGGLNGADGFRIGGVNARDLAGGAIDAAGDFNGDGFDDLIVGAEDADVLSLANAGKSYLVFGQASGFAPDLLLGGLNGADGFSIEGVDSYDNAGGAVSGAGDVNGDGVDDVVIGAHGAEAAYVVFGQTGGFPQSFSLASLNGANGFKVSSAYIGAAVGSAGDINGDGFDDLAFGAQNASYQGYGSGSAFILFGQASGFAADVDLGTLTGADGFRVDGLANYASLGSSVAGIGDFNGDGFDDVLLGAQGASGDGGYYIGASIVLFGRPGGFAPVVDASALNGADGFVIDDAMPGDRAGASVSAAGDVNGDGFDDLLVGAPYAQDDSGQYVGASYILFGRDVGGVTAAGDAGANTLAGGATADVLVGGQGDDTLIGGGGQDVLRGGEGDDILTADDSGFRRIDGGFGFDMLRLVQSAQTLDFTLAGDQGVTEIEGVDLAGGGATVLLDPVTVRALSSTSNSVRIAGDTSNLVDLAGPGWISTAFDAATVTLRNASAEVVLDRALALAVANNDPTPVDDIVATNEDLAVNGNLLADNGGGVDMDVDGDIVFVDTTPAIDVANGVLILNENGDFTYTPNLNFNGVDSFAYKLRDGKGGSADATVTINVAPVNDDPVAAADAVATGRNTPLNGDVLADNGAGVDSDIDGDPLTVDVNPVVDVADGMLTLNAGGGFVYVPNAGFTGVDSFTYRLLDGAGGEDFGTVTIDVAPTNTPPTVGAAVRAAPFEDAAPIVVDLLEGASDVDGDMLSVADLFLIAGDASGVTVGATTLQIDPAGYDSLAVGELETLRYRYNVSDGNGGLTRQSAIVNIRGRNDAPVAEDDDFVTAEDTPLNGDVLADNGMGADLDIDGDLLSVDPTPVGDAAHGLLNLNANGSFSYIPDADFNGFDAFTYRVLDPNGGVATATASIFVQAVNDAPVLGAAVRAASTEEDAPFQVDLLASAVDPDGDGLAVSGLRPIAGDDAGVAIVGAMLQVTPALYDSLAAGEVESIRYRYSVVDGNGGSAPQAAIVNIRGRNDAPIAADDAFAGLQGDRIVGDLMADNGMGADLDIDGDTLTVDGQPATTPAFGRVAISPDGAFVYTPDADFFGVDGFSYRLSDGNGGVDVGQVAIAVAEDLSNVFFNTPGDDVFNGDGRSEVRYDHNATGGLFADLRQGFVFGGGDIGDDRVAGMFETRGGDFDDILFGADAPPAAASPFVLLGPFESYQGLAGDDLVYGRDGMDRANYARAPMGVEVDLGDAIATQDGFGGVDTLFSVEGVQGTRFADTLIGGDGDEFFQPGRGADTVDGGAGADLLVMAGVASGVRIDLAAGTMLHRNGDMAAIRNIEHVEAGDDADIVIGGNGANTIAAGGGADRVIGRAGDDRLLGGVGDDVLFANSGDDRMTGGAGDDRLIASFGAEILLFAPGSGRDLVQNFTPGEDRLDVSAYGFADAAAVVGLIDDVDGAAEIALNGAVDVIRLEGVMAGDLAAGDFIV